MGLGLENFDESVPSEFLCPCCRGIVLDPVLTECDHILCAKCFSKRMKRRQTCPTCAKALAVSEKRINTVWMRRYNRLEVNCTKGCEKLLSLGSLKDHLMSHCPLTFTQCGNTGCCRRVRRLDLASHLAECDFRIVQCEGCSYQTRYMNLRMHQIVQKCLLRRNLHSVVQNRREMSARVKEHRRRLQEESFRRELENRDSEKAKMWSAIMRERPYRAVSPALNSGALFHSQSASSSPTQSRNSHSRSGRLCINCHKLFTDKFNHPEACVFHQGVSFRRK